MLARLRIAAALSAAGAVALTGASTRAQTQAADPDFDVAVERPAYSAGGPLVVIDGAHANFHTASGRYRPFADLLRSDGYTVIAGASAFAPDALADVDVLVIANALPPPGAAPGATAFSTEESDTVADWVAGGGSLLLVADHAPFGAAAAGLARRFGVDMGEGWAWETREAGSRVATRFVASRENGRLGSHPVLSGRGPEEAVTTLMAFSGQSLGAPPGASVLMRLNDSAREAANRDDLAAIRAAVEAGTDGAAGLVERLSTPAGGRAQGLALTFGRGRVVVLGEAAMLSAQISVRGAPMGMNVPGSDNRQFALNVLHWLSGLVP